MEKNEFRVVIKHLHMKGLTLKEIKAELDNVHSISRPAFATLYNWVNEFKRGCTSICDAPRLGRPIETASPEIINKIHDIVLIDRQVKVCELVEITGISRGTLISIFHEQLYEKTIGKMDAAETWIHYFTPETKEQSKQRRPSPGESAPKKAKTVKSAGKVMVSFWNARGIIHIDYLSSKQTINSDYYAALLDRFNVLKKKHPHLVKKMLFYQDNAWVHTCPALVAKFNEFRYELLPHPVYSPDLALCYFLFPNLKKWFGGKRFITKEQLIAET
ncbi:PREDICTED: histone-lysine N-methyltransferase SETMAR-like [Atta cephalotes]|uniref:Mos1 transposase HTH domain-containing protein n=1 Tax=Atta cephalotes TaxID=12957 RepID=A0A158NJI0_ATTCE|nr:PREDICTED: histone-lysine N-methyltransferase SETMAR-like [Atta cephalotes]